MGPRGTGGGGVPDTEAQRESEGGKRGDGNWVVVVEGGEAAAAAAVVAVVVAAGEAFGSDNGKHSFSLRVSVHQGRGPGGGGFVSSRLTLVHSHANVLGFQLPSCPTNKMGSIQASSPPRKTERGYKTVNSGAGADLGFCRFRGFYPLFQGST